jgi:hypothetical protein
MKAFSKNGKVSIVAFYCIELLVSGPPPAEEGYTAF